MLFEPQNGNGPYEKYVFGTCQQEGGLNPWWTITDIPNCAVENTGKRVTLFSLKHRHLVLSGIVLPGAHEYITKYANDPIACKTVPVNANVSPV